MSSQKQTLSILKEDAWRLTRLSDENVGILVKALLNNLECGCEPTFNDPLLSYVYEDLKRSNPVVQETDTTVNGTDDYSNVNGITNNICTREEYEQARTDLKHNSSLFNKQERKLLRDLLKRNRERKPEKYGEPLRYTTAMANEISVAKNIIYQLRQTLAGYNVMGWRSILPYPSAQFKANEYYINESELCKLIHDNVELDNAKEPEIEVTEPEPVQAELVYSTSSGPVEGKKERKLNAAEEKMLYWLYEASQLKENKVRDDKFICTVDSLCDHMDCGTIRKTRQSLVNKGYIEAEIPNYTTAYVYRIVKFPEYLRNKAE